MHVTVAIVGYCNALDIARCIDSLIRSTYQDFEIVICENGGPAAHTELEKQIPSVLPGGQKVTIIKAPNNLGYAGGINVCIKATLGADAWWVLNPDTLPHSSALECMVKRLQVGDCEAVGSTLQLMSGPIQCYGGRWQAWLGRPISLGYGRLASEIVDKKKIEIRQNYLSGASMIVGRRFLELTGFMREDYFLYCEEIEWCLRGIRNGVRLGFAPDAVVFHHSGKTMQEPNAPKSRSFLPDYLKERNRVLLTRELYPFLLPTVIALGIPLMAYKVWLRKGWHHFAYGLRGYFAGILGKRGVPAWFEKNL